jgi:hypothetical protein
MIEAGATSTWVQQCAVRSVVPAPPGVIMVAPPTVPRNAEGAQSERPRCLTGARQNNAANNTRIIKARPGHPEGYPGLRAMHDPTGQLRRSPMRRSSAKRRSRKFI